MFPLSRRHLIPVVIVAALGSLWSFQLIAAGFEFSGDLRSYSFQRDFRDGRTDQEALALGGILRGRLHPSENLMLGLSLYTSQGLGMNDDSKDVYSLLARDSNGDHAGYTSLGEAFVEARTESLLMRLGRQEINTPWLNTHDVRMTPHSFDGVYARWNTYPNDSLRMCHIAEMKTRTEKTARPMSEVAGFGDDEGVTCLGYEHKGDIGMQLWGYRVHEMWDDLYLRLDYKPGGKNWFINGRYLDRQSQGDRLAGDQSTWHAGLTAGLKLDRFDFSGAVSRNGNNNIRYSWGHATTISSQVMVANRAEETAWKIKAAYQPEFSSALKLALSIASHDAPETGANQAPDQQEYNFDLQFNLQEHVPGMTFRARYAIVDETGIGAQDLTDTRFYLRYRFELD